MWNIKTNADLVRFLYRYAFDEMRIGARDGVDAGEMWLFAEREAANMVDLNPAWNHDEDKRMERISVITYNLMDTYYEQDRKWHPNYDDIPF